MIEVFVLFYFSSFIKFLHNFIAQKIVLLGILSLNRMQIVNVQKI